MLQQQVTGRLQPRSNACGNSPAARQNAVDVAVGAVNDVHGVGNQTIVAAIVPSERSSPRWRIDDIKQTIWLTRPDLRSLCEDQYDRFEWWLLLNGAREYRALAETEFTFCHNFLTEPAEGALPEVRPTMTRFMRLAWTMQPDLRRRFDLSTSQGQQGLVWWYFTRGPAELGLARFFTAEQLEYLNEPDDRMPHGMPIPITRLMMQVWSWRPDLQQAFLLDTPKGRAAYVVWYFTHGLTETQLADLVDEAQAQALLSPGPGAPDLAPVLAMIWSEDVAVRERFPKPLDPEFGDWSRGEGPARYPILKRLAEMAAPAPLPTPAIASGSGDLPAGYNLIGYAHGQFGIGEDVRMAALAKQAAGIPFSIYNIEPGREVCQGDDSAQAFLSDRLPYAVNLLCTTGIETARLAAVHGSALFDSRRTIGYWPWELPEWPAEWHHAYDLVDEVWASSRYTYDAYTRSSPRPVRHMPMAVTVDATAGLQRRDFGLPKNKFLFVFSFDVLSGLARKNPQACVRAFQKAFPRGDEPVGLVVKAMRAVPGNPAWDTLLADTRADDRISIIARTLSRGQVLDLYRACDCFVSLHRAEGFGRWIAEAMMLGKAVITTGWSGNMDFTTAKTATLVGYELRPIGTGEYPFAAGLLWAEPDTNDAAQSMRAIANASQYGRQMVANSRECMSAKYDLPSVGERYAEALRLALL